MNALQADLLAFTPSTVKAIDADWRNQLAKRLGQRPRRIGEWAELAIYGALHCLDQHGIARLNPHARIRVTSTNGPTHALSQSWLTCADNSLPMPFDFLQSQPSQMLAALSQHLQWQGDASFSAHKNVNALFAHFQSEANNLKQQAQRANLPWEGLLFGYVDIEPVLMSHWCLIR